jgi:PIF1-like helicase
LDQIYILTEKRFSGVPAEDYGNLMEMYIDSLNGMSEACIDLVQGSQLFATLRARLEEFARLKKHLRAHFIPLYSGSWFYTNKYLFLPELALHFGRPMFYSQAFAPLSHNILLRRLGNGDRDLGHTTYVRTLGTLGLLDDSLRVQGEIEKLRPTLLRPTLPRTAVPSRRAKACRCCFMLFGADQLKERFDAHPCTPHILGERLGTKRDVTRDAISLDDERFLKYRADQASKRSEEQRMLIDIFFNKRVNVIVVGAAGTGKTHGAIDIIETVAQQEGLDGFVRVSKNKKNAEMIGGKTINAQFRFGLLNVRDIYQFIHMRGQARLNAVRDFVATRIRGTRYEDEILRGNYFMLDEFGNISKEFFEFVDLVVREIRGNHAQPFGGMQVILTGDPTQNKPFVEASTKEAYLKFTGKTWGQGESSDALDYLFQSPFIFDCGYHWLVFTENQRMKFCKRLVTFNSLVRLSDGTGEERLYMSDINERTEVPIFHQHLSYVADLVAHLKKDFEGKKGFVDGLTDNDVVNFMQDPCFYDELHSSAHPWYAKKSNVFDDKVARKSLLVDRIRHSFNTAVDLLRGGWLAQAREYISSGQDTADVTHIVTDRCQVDAYAFLEGLLIEGLQPILESAVEDSVVYLNSSGDEAGNCMFQGDVLNNSSIRDMMKNESIGKLQDHLRVFAGKRYLITSNSSGHFLSSNDVVITRGISQVDGKDVVDVDVVLNSPDQQMPMRTIGKEICVEIVLERNQLPFDLQRRVPEGNRVLIRRRQYPLVNKAAITTVKSVGLTITSKVVANNTRTVKAGDMYLCSSRCRNDVDLFFTHIPQTVEEMNTHDFVCHLPAKTLIEYLSKRRRDAFDNPVILGNFHLHHDGRTIIRTSSSRRGHKFWNKFFR